MAGAFFVCKEVIYDKVHGAKKFSEIADTYGVMQNLSSDANIEVTDNTDDAGTCSLVVIPFQNSADESTNENSSDDESETNLDEYGDLFLFPKNSLKSKRKFLIQFDEKW